MKKNHKKENLGNLMNLVKACTVKYLVLTLPLLFGTAELGAQVTMGADAAPKPFSVLELVSQYKTGTYGGLRLPQMNTIQRTALSDTYGADPLFEGLMIYNDSIHCVEYWNATKWVSLCTGTADITLDGDCATDHLFAADGSDVCTFTPEDHPPCVVSVGQAYLVYLTAGSAYATLLVDELTSAFTLTFAPNNSNYNRVAVVRVTNNCSGEYKDFPFWQEKADCPSGVGDFTVGTTSLTLCGNNGAVIAWVNNSETGIDYVWAYGGTIVHTGNYFQITRAGTYTVYAGLLGCEEPPSKSITVIQDDGYSSNAPVVTATNGGVLCDGGNVMLTASNIAAGNDVLWFHNDSLCRSCTTNPLVLNSSSDAGEWFATQQDDPCGSRMSNIVPVIDETAISTTLPTPAIYANGDSLTNSSIVCKNGTVELAVHNADVYSGGTLFEWFDNSVLIASGTATVIYYNVPDEDEMNLWVQASDMSGACPATAVSDLIEITLPAPPPTVINNGASTVPICGTTPATLVALNASGSNYQWFKDGVSVATTVDPFYQVYSIGSYTVRFEDAQGCWTLISSPITVIMSSPLFLSWNIEPETPVNLSDMKTYTVLSSPAADSYTWSSSDESVATVTPVPPGNTVSVNYIGEDFVTIRVDAENACGSAFLEKEIEVKPNCTSPSVSITPNTTVRLLLDPAGNPIAGYDKATFFADAMGGTTPIDYEWYVNSAFQNTGSSFTYTATSSFGTVDTVYVAATNECTASDVVKSEKVVILLGIRYDYTGSYQTFTAPHDGRYQIELWGGYANYNGLASYAGYTSGEIYLNSGDVLYVYVGQTAQGDCIPYTSCTGLAWNGGASGGYCTMYFQVRYLGGAGATDIRLVATPTLTTWDEAISLRSRIMVAAGSSPGRGSVYGLDVSPGYGGGLTGYNGGSGINAVGGGGGSQTAGGSAGLGAGAGSFGRGGTGYVAQAGSDNNQAFGGGGGYYGGGGGRTGSLGTGNYTASGGGGSSFISGHAGCNAINSGGTHTGQPNHYSGKVFTNTVMIDGLGYGWTNVRGGLKPMPNPYGGFYGSGTGHTDNGVAIITYLGE